MSWDAVRRFRDRLTTAGPPAGTSLSPAGAHEAASAALSALSDDALSGVAALPVAPFETATVVAARTVFTAPLEWCAVLLGRGTAVTLKLPRGGGDWGAELAEAAAAERLPLTVTRDRDVFDGADLVVAMGTDDTIRQIRDAVPPTARLLAHGHRFSAAWVTGDNWDAVAMDVALYDTRGCFSPMVVFTPLPLGAACAGLYEAMTRAEARWPRGAVAPIEGAQIRSRRALARVLGTVWLGEGFEVHGLPAERAQPTALPRAPVVVSVSEAREALGALGASARWLSTIGTDDSASTQLWLDAGASRVCPLGTMQRPPLARIHDGVDWLMATGRAAP